MRKEKGIFIIFTGILIAITRTFLNEENQDDILVIMAVINYVALGFVFLFLQIKVMNNIKDNIKNSGINTTNKEIRKSIGNIGSSILLFAYFIFGYVYIGELKSAEYNDALSIFALSLSIASENLEDTLSKLFYKFIVMFSNIVYKIYSKITQK